MIHSQALGILGLKNRLDKLRKELVEAANAIDRYEEGKCSIDDVLHEFRDVLYVWGSVSISDEFIGADERVPLEEHRKVSDEKLKKAIADARCDMEATITDTILQMRRADFLARQIPLAL